ncbi:hypothetical protein Tco_0913554 [Tanacetum coccineum]
MGKSGWGSEGISRDAMFFNCDDVSPPNLPRASSKSATATTSERITIAFAETVKRRQRVCEKRLPQDDSPALSFEEASGGGGAERGACAAGDCLCSKKGSSMSGVSIVLCTLHPIILPFKESALIVMPLGAEPNAVGGRKTHLLEEKQIPSVEQLGGIWRKYT